FAVAAGNSGPACGSASTPPGGDPAAFSVGAVNADNVVAEFSSRGPVTVDGRSITKPQLSAPGVDELSSLPGGGYGRMSGTSMAAPHVAGAVAALWSAVPELVGDVEATGRLLRDTATPASSENAKTSRECGSQNTIGAGVLNVAAALEAARSR
ncbi:MAG: S8 family serine peptidase, partial [Stackebrandtia sp.]